MSAWRRKAMACLPELKKDIERKECSIYEVFSALLSATIAAHQQGDHIQLKACYEFAAWCLEQNDEKLWNAAGVSFYEHLGDREETLRTMPQWVGREVYVQVRGLMAWRIGEEKMKEVDRLYGV